MFLKIKSQKIAILSCVFFFGLSFISVAFADSSNQLQPYLDKMNEEKKQKEIAEKERQDQQNGIQVPGIDVQNVSNNTMPVSQTTQKTKKQEVDPEEFYEQEFMNKSETYRKITRSKPYLNKGVMYYTYGEGVPLLICSPKHVCDIELENGENITNIQMGDSTRWILNVNNTEGSEPHVYLKPVSSDIKTNMIISTNKRTYTLDIKSDKQKYFDKIAFNYKDGKDESKMSIVYMDIPEKTKYAYYIRGDNTNWTPTEIRTDGKKTFIRLSDKVKNSTDFPTVYSLNDDESEGLVNERYIKNWIIVDSMLDRGELKSGVGLSQRKVIFTRQGSVGVISKLLSED